MTTDKFAAQVKNTLKADYEQDGLLLLQYLIEIQRQHSCIPEDAIVELSQQLSIPPAEINGVISFYSFLHNSPRGTYDILVSDNITDQMQHSGERLKQFKSALSNIPDVSIDTTSCTGMSDQGPGLLVNGQAIASLDEQKTENISKLISQQIPLDQWPEELFRIDDNIKKRDLLLSGDFKNGSALQALKDSSSDALLERIKTAGLRGRGGAGFPTASKWDFCRQSQADQRYVICNADEGEPGTFKDRVLLNSFADIVIEGMTLCAGIIKASQGFIYLRGEYRYLVPKLQHVLQQRRDDGLLGQNILGIDGFNFDIDIHLGAGAYICGEESALIESLEGKRGVPRKRPPFPVSNGYCDKPTVVNNVETFMAAARIAEHSADWFHAAGTEQSAGTKILSISGDCTHPGIYEYAFGTSLTQILQDCGATDTQAVQVAGAAGNLYKPEEFGRQLSFEDVATAGSFMVLDNSRDLVAMIQNFSDFFVHESCGFCTPCRVGTSLIKDLVIKLANGHATPYDLEEMKKIGALMKTSSHCGLGATAPNALLDLINKFPDLLQDKLAHTDYEPAFDLDAALQEARDITGRDDAGAHLGGDQ